MADAIVVGGSGFVGRHLVRYLLDREAYGKIIIADIQPPEWEYRSSPVPVTYIDCDVRNPIPEGPFREEGCDKHTVIYNLAAICRIPGYPDIDYFRTNIRGAETVCDLADSLGASRMVFTSSIAPYGASEELKTEESIPQPDNPYGNSKLVAEYIHRGWQQRDPDHRVLGILRPGIIFGKNEQANFTRLYNAMKGGYFFYPGRFDTRKACIYVKDVARACHRFSLEQPGVHLYNLVYPDPPEIQEICRTVAEVTDAKYRKWLIPGPLLVMAARVINAIARVFGKNLSGIHPDRVKKVMISTNVSGNKLQEYGFSLDYTLEEGIADWFGDCDRQSLC